MDTHDVKDLPEVFQRIAQQKKSLCDAQSRKGQRPRRDPAMTLIFNHNLQRMTNEMRNLASMDGGTATYGTTFVPPPYPPCIRPLAELTKTTIDKLVLETQHRGTYLLVRCVTRQDRLTAVTAIVEDENRDAILLQLYHQELAFESTEDILNLGRVLIIKEPYLKFTANGGYALRVDHVGDVVFLAPDDERIPPVWLSSGVMECTASGWKTTGNERFERGEYRAAIEAYTQALECTPTAAESDTIHLNRSLAFIRMGAFDRALSDISAASSADSSEKALYRKAQALYGLQRFRDCCEVLKTLRQQYPNNKTARDLLNRAVARVAEQLHGRYDFKKMLDEAAKLRPPHLDHATYIGGPVVIKDSVISPAGRGMFTTRAVSAGELLLCEKAFAHVFVDESGTGAQALPMTMVIDAVNNRASMGAENELLNQAVQKLWRNPSLASAITNLHHGSYQPVDATSSVDGNPIIDTFLIRQIMALNSFGCPLTSRESVLGSSSKGAATTKQQEAAFHSSGIWPQASHINHSCTSNVRRCFIGDMMTVRATRDLPADAELVWWYRPPPSGVDATYLEHQKTFRSQWGFTCKCAMCRDLRDTPRSVLQRRRQLLDEFASLLGTSPQQQSRGLAGGGGGGRRPLKAGVLKKASAIVQKLDATYKNTAPTRVPRPAVAGLNMELARRLADGTEAGAAESARYALAALEACGFVICTGQSPGRGPLVVKEWGLMIDTVLDAWLYLQEAYWIVAPHLAVSALGYARTAYKICVGEDVSFGDALAGQGTGSSR
ncbi:hypothetical protein QBC47DRAFT_304481 [Echria macrotheca]|uniref:SET domain-containing protein n=1 Tax=Echria macrotheca TaxID=438768 RepID=A0AAJ0BAQ3_9PEZI|nr:hypothetical protein QBC47DRAFT_304481 [Echria macrotheca]